MAAVVPFVCRFSWPLVLSRRWRRFASRLVSRLVWAFCVVGRLVSVFILLRRFCQFVFPCCLVCSRRCCCSIRVRPVVRVGWRRVVEALRRGGAWLPWYGRYGCCVAICDAMRSGVAWGGSVMSCRAAGRERDEWRDDECAVFVSSSTQAIGYKIFISSLARSPLARSPSSATLI